MSFLALDLSILKWVNTGLGRAGLDPLFIAITTVKTWIAPAAVGAGILLARGRRKGLAVLAAGALAVLLGDGISSRIIKPLVGRLRPCNTVAGLRLPDGRRGTLAFPSGHATNSAAIGTVLASAFPPFAPIAAFIVFMVGLSRVYLGLHFPSDVIGGFLIGTPIGWLCWRFVAGLPAFHLRESKAGDL